MNNKMNKQKRKRVDSPEDAANQQIGAGHLRLSVALQCHMQKEMGGSIYCTQAELPKSALIARLLELGELKAVDFVFDVSVQKLCGYTFNVQMGSDDNTVLTLKHKIKKTEGTSEDCQDLVLLDEGAGGGGAGGKSAPAGVGVDAPDRLALADGAVLPGACCVVLQVKESGAFDNLFCFVLLYFCVRS